LSGTLSYHGAAPMPGKLAPPSIGTESKSRNESSTAFFSHWCTTHSPPTFSAVRKVPSSSPAIAASTESRTSPLVALLMPSRFSHAASIAVSSCLLIVPSENAAGPYMLAAMAFKLPESVLVVVHTPALEVLLLERAAQPGFWQSVTGSREPGDADLSATARRELREETGLTVGT